MNRQKKPKSGLSVAIYTNSLTFFKTWYVDMRPRLPPGTSAAKTMYLKPYGRGFSNTLYWFDFKHMEINGHSEVIWCGQVSPAACPPVRKSWQSFEPLEEQLGTAHDGIFQVPVWQRIMNRQIQTHGYNF